MLDPAELLSKQNLSLEELQLPLRIMQELRQSLDSSAAMFPDSARLLQKWQVGLLDRYVENTQTWICPTLQLA